MNLAEGMSDQEIDFWADLFYQAKISGVIEVTFSQFMREPFTHLGVAPTAVTPQKKQLLTSHWCLQQAHRKSQHPKRGRTHHF